ARCSSTSPHRSWARRPSSPRRPKKSCWSSAWTGTASRRSRRRARLPDPMSDNASGRAGSAFDAAVAAGRAGADPRPPARNLYHQLTEAERLGLLDGDAPFWAGLAAMRAARYGSRPYVHGEVARLGIPGIRFVDGPRGCVAGDGTAFPVPMARGATWDTGLEQRVGEAIGAEVRAQGGNFYGGGLATPAPPPPPGPGAGGRSPGGRPRGTWARSARRWPEGRSDTSWRAPSTTRSTPWRTPASGST